MVSYLYNLCKYPVVYRVGETRVVTNKRKKKKIYTCIYTSVLKSLSLN